MSLFFGKPSLSRSRSDIYNNLQLKGVLIPIGFLSKKSDFGSVSIITGTGIRMVFMSPMTERVSALPAAWERNG